MTRQIYRFDFGFHIGLVNLDALLVERNLNGMELLLLPLSPIQKTTCLDFMYPSLGHVDFVLSL